MKRPLSYLKLKVLGAIDYAKGRTIRERIKKVSYSNFIDESGSPRKFTWRTISTWLYRDCITKGLFSKNALAPTTFYRLLREYELLKPEEECQNKLRMAFSMQYANQPWQADAMFGPHLRDEKGRAWQPHYMTRR